MRRFDAERFLELLIENVVSCARAGKQFVANPNELGPRLISLQLEIGQLELDLETAKQALDETDSQLPDEADSSQSSS